jgi:hypothetical protein
MGDKNDSLRSDADGTARQSKSEVTPVASQHTGAANQSTFPRPVAANADTGPMYIANSDRVGDNIDGQAVVIERSVSGAVVDTAKRVVNFIKRFITRAVAEDWIAAPIAFAGSMLGTYLTAVGVVAAAPALERHYGSPDSAGYVFATSSLAVFLGYATYILFYGAGMLWKERSSLLDDEGKLSREKIGRTWQVFKIDFFMHLPSDAWWVVGMFGAQGGLYATGTSDLFWSILLTQGLSDLYYSAREPFYWQASKLLAAKFYDKEKPVDIDPATLQEVANSDVAQPSGIEDGSSSAAQF